MFWQNKNLKTPRRRDPSGARLMATMLGSLRSYLSKSNQSPLNIVHITRSMWYFAGIWYWLPTKPMSPRICCRRAQKCDSQQTLAARLHWWCNCKPWRKLGIEHRMTQVLRMCNWKVWMDLSKMERSQSPLILTLLTGAATSQMPQPRWALSHSRSSIFGFVVFANVVPESSRFTWNICEERGYVYFEDRYTADGGFKDAMTLSNMQLWFGASSYGRSWAHGWYSTGWGIAIGKNAITKRSPDLCTRFPRLLPPHCRHSQSMPFNRYT